MRRNKIEIIIEGEILSVVDEYIIDLYNFKKAVIFQKSNYFLCVNMVVFDKNGKPIFKEVIDCEKLQELEKIAKDLIENGFEAYIEESLYWDLMLN